MPETTGMITKSKSNNSEWYVVFLASKCFPQKPSKMLYQMFDLMSPPENRTYLLEEYE